jgi:hypothetical protein
MFKQVVYQLKTMCMCYPTIYDITMLVLVLYMQLRLEFNLTVALTKKTICTEYKHYSEVDTVTSHCPRRRQFYTLIIPRYACYIG